MPILLAMILAALSSAMLLQDRSWGGGAAAFLALALLVLGAVVLVLELRRWATLRALSLSVSTDTAACFVSDETGQILYMNDASKHQIGEHDTAVLEMLQSHFVSPASVLYRLQARARLDGAAREDIQTKQGQSRLSVHSVAKDIYLWRFEEISYKENEAKGNENIAIPMLTADESGDVISTNAALRALIGSQPTTLEQIFGPTPPYHAERADINGAHGTFRGTIALYEKHSDDKNAPPLRDIFFLPNMTPDLSGNSAANFDHLPVALLRFSARGALIAANRTACDLLAITQDGTYAFHDLYEGLGRPVQDWLNDIVEGRVKEGAEFLRPRSGKHESYHQVTLRRVVSDGNPEVVAVLQDATAMKSLEAQFVQSQKMQAIGQLAGGIAHDFNNLLTAISGHCDLLLIRHDHHDGDYADLVQIQQNANRAAALVSQLLAFSRKQTLKPECFDIQDVLADLTHLLNRLVGEKVSLQLVHGDKIGSVRVDKRQFEQVLMNLVVNARDAMRRGGVINVETRALRLHNELRRDRAVVPVGDYAVISVTDTGEGIPPDRAEKIFEPFFTTKRPGEGTGLGLSTVYGIVKQSGGFVFVDSAVGEGSTFHIYFPIHHTNADTTAEAPAPNNVVMRQGEGVILLVEDEAPVRAFAGRALRMRGYTVLEAEDAEEALTILEDDTLEVDLFVTDVVMPGLDGPSWVKQARDSRPDVKVVFMSGYAEDCLSEEQTRTPNAVFLAKPFSLTELTKTVQEQLP